MNLYESIKENLIESKDLKLNSLNIEECYHKLSNAEIPNDISSTKDIDNFVISFLPKGLVKEYLSRVKGIKDIADRQGVALTYLEELLNKIADEDEEEDTTTTNQEHDPQYEELTSKQQDLWNKYDELLKQKVKSPGVLDKLYNSILNLCDCKSLHDFDNLESDTWDGKLHIFTDSNKYWPHVPRFLDKDGDALYVNLDLYIYPNDNKSDVYNLPSSSDAVIPSLEKHINLLENKIQLVEKGDLLIHGRITVGSGTKAKHFRIVKSTVNNPNIKEGGR